MKPSDIKLDRNRKNRIGLNEAIFCANKSVPQLIRILEEAESNNTDYLFTRLDTEKFDALPIELKDQIDYDPHSATGYFGEKEKAASKTQIAIVSAGTSDSVVCMEAVRTLNFYGQECACFFDVGVAGIWRLMERVEEIKTYPVVIVVAGMDAALPSVVGGLVPGLVIGVPTSNGYGATHNGTTALNSMLVSCAPGILVCNIDNGYGAACAAIRALWGR